MELTFEKIREITVGAIQMKRQEDGIHFYKCTDSQIQAWYQLDQILGERSETGTGVRMDFWTDSSEVKIDLCKAKVDVAINGLLEKRYEYDDLDFHEITILMPEGENRITIFLPSHDIAVVKRVCLENGSTIKAHTYRRKMLFIGDSITQGWDSGFDSFSYAYLTSEALNAESVINGIGGSFYDTSTFAVPDFDADIVVVAYGTNDFIHYADFEEFKKEVTDYLGLVKNAYGDKKVFVIAPIWRFDSLERAMGSFDDCRNAIQSIAEGYGFYTVDGYKMVPHVKAFFADDVHPNALGFSEYAKNLVAAIGNECKKTGE